MSPRVLCADFIAIIVPKDSNVEITMSYENFLKLTNWKVSDFDTVVSENEHLQEVRWEIGEVEIAA